MKIGANVFALALLTLISTCGLCGCSKQAPGTTTKTDTQNNAAEKGDKHAEHAEAHAAAKTGGHAGLRTLRLASPPARRHQRCRYAPWRGIAR